MTGQPLISIDVVPLRFTQQWGMQVALGPRIFEPFLGRLALPGVLLASEERLEAAAYRALSTKAGLESADVRALVQVSALDNPDRDPRGPSVSLSYLAVISPEANSRAEWANVDGHEPLPFDHDRIVELAVDRIGVSLWHPSIEALRLTRSFTGELFSTRVAAQLTEAATGARPEPANFNRMLRTSPHLERSDEVDASGPGRPAALWRWA